MIRVRFAPSPTGFLHIGGVRTALFNYLYAKNQNGKFLLRIEDTDQLRSKPEFEQEILESLKWLGLHWDEDLVYQSRRVSRHRELAEQLLAKDLAYESVQDGKKAVVFRMPRKAVIFEDAVHGRTEFDASLFDDLVIMKSDGFPTYHFACVVDDHEMEISHIIRGDDHLSNTPRQILLYEAFGWKPPKFAHLPLIAGADGTPLSKRHGAVAISHYRRLGYVPEAILNFLALLGWGSEGNQEIFMLEELCRKFSLKKVNKGKSIFNQEKFLWLNGQHLKRMPETEYLERLTAFYPDLSRGMPAEQWRKLALLYRTRIKIFSELKEETYLFEDDIAYAASECDKLWADSRLLETLGVWAEKTAGLENFESHEVLEKLTREMAESKGYAAKELIHPFRFILTGKTVSPGLFELMSVLGKGRVLRRVSAFVEKRVAKVLSEG